MAELANYASQDGSARRSRHLSVTRPTSACALSRWACRAPARATIVRATHRTCRAGIAMHSTHGLSSRPNAHRPTRPAGAYGMRPTRETDCRLVRRQRACSARGLTGFPRGLAHRAERVWELAVVRTGVGCGGVVPWATAAPQATAPETRRGRSAPARAGIEQRCDRVRAAWLRRRNPAVEIEGRVLAAHGRRPGLLNTLSSIRRTR